MWTIVSTVIGMIFSLAVAFYFHKLSMNKELKIYTLLNRGILSNIRKDIKSDMSFTFQNQSVDNLRQVEFLVGNAGLRAIDNIEKNLTLSIPEDVKVLDVSVIYESPESIDVVTEKSEDGVSINFSLLNSGDFFILKMLVDGELNQKDLKFSIVASDLPRNLQQRDYPFAF